MMPGRNVGAEQAMVLSHETGAESLFSYSALLRVASGPDCRSVSEFTRCSRNPWRNAARVNDHRRSALLFSSDRYERTDLAPLCRSIGTSAYSNCDVAVSADGATYVIDKAFARITRIQ